MERQKAQAVSTPRYPTRTSFQPRRKSLVCAGLLLVTIGAVGCPGDVAVPIDGDMIVPSETFFVSLPAEGSRTVFFQDSDRYVAFHVELVVDNRDLSVFLDTNARELLNRVAVTVAGAPPEELESGQGMRELERRVCQLLANQWTGSQDAPLYNFVECVVIIDDSGYEEIDGDMPA